MNISALTVRTGPLRIVQYAVVLLVAAGATILLDHVARGLSGGLELLVVIAATVVAYAAVGVLAHRAGAGQAHQRSS